MVKYISTICVTVLMSLFLFPIELKAFPGMNSKKFWRLWGSCGFSSIWENTEPDVSAKIW